jgi:4-hydroxythreonine-4-phosphate dehydrogenase
MSGKKPILGLTMGDPAGIGPEILVKALRDSDIYDLCRPLIIGDAGILEKTSAMTGAGVDVRPVSKVESAGFKPGLLDVLIVKTPDLGSVTFGRVSPAAGAAAFLYVKRAIELALNHYIDGTVTGPINKEAIHAGGYPYSGHTEIYAHFTKTRDYAMLLADGDFRIIHVSTHVALKKAVTLVKTDRIVTVIRLLDNVCRKFGIESPRIGVAGLNPHSGDGGLFGDEEEKEIIPAISAAVESGIQAEGPVPPDTLFARATSGFSDGCVAMYHDQGHIPFKMAGFSWNRTGRMEQVRGVNITLGLPIIRTSVDHGTAFEIAGQGIADPSGLKQAISMAAQLVDSQ